MKDIDTKETLDAIMETLHELKACSEEQERVENTRKYYFKQTTTASSKSNDEIVSDAYRVVFKDMLNQYRVAVETLDIYAFNGKIVSVMRNRYKEWSLACTSIYKVKECVYGTNCFHDELAAAVKYAITLVKAEDIHAKKVTKAREKLVLILTTFDTCMNK